MKKTNIILTGFMLVASIASAQQTFTNVALKGEREETAVVFTVPSEANTSSFRIEASNNGTEYTILSVMSSKGNTVLPRTYTQRLFEPNYKYYRVGRVSMGGSLSYSQSVEIIEAKSAPQMPASDPAIQTLANNARREN